MTTIRVTCSACRAHFDVATSVPRWTVECPNCHTQLHGSSEPAIQAVVPQAVTYRRSLSSPQSPTAADKGTTPPQWPAAPRLVHIYYIYWAGLLGFVVGGALIGGCTALRRYSPAAYRQQVTRAERAEKELAAMTASRSVAQPRTVSSTSLTPRSATHNSRPFEPVQRAVKPARAVLDGDVTITISVTELSGARVRLSGMTNLPTGTHLMLSVEEKAQGGFIGQAKCSVAADGSFESETFGPSGGLPPGVYVADVVMPVPAVQPESVKNIIGGNGENLSGPLVENEPFGVTAVAKCEFTLGGAEAAHAQKQRVNARIQEYRGWQGKLASLDSRLTSARGNDRAKWGQFAREFLADIKLHQDQLLKVEPISARFAIGDALDAVRRMFHATAFQEPRDYSEATADYKKSLKKLQEFIETCQSATEASGTPSQ